MARTGRRGSPVGAVVNAKGPVITVDGPTRLVDADVEGEDIRAVTALVLAGLAARVASATGITLQPEPTRVGRWTISP
ncbi:hypothetical protein [Kitasatospora sp. NPDC091276]|uniref:hypothetical protein n=1 Tax=Kitasatospora sp. NPDC091276 TaxID=3155300 RepID=UPI00342DE39F